MNKSQCVLIQARVVDRVVRVPLREAGPMILFTRRDFCTSLKGTTRRIKSLVMSEVQ